jgi:hypothetical protein
MMLDEKRIVGTDIATWFLFHPDDLAHRLQDPAEWCWHEFAISKEFASGNNDTAFSRLVKYIPSY